MEVAVDCSRKLILSQLAQPAPINDCASLPMFVSAADNVLPVGLILADAEFDSEKKSSVLSGTNWRTEYNCC